MKILHIIVICLIIYIIYTAYNQDEEYFDDKFGFNKTDTFNIKNGLNDSCLGQYIGYNNDRAIIGSCVTTSYLPWENMPWAINDLGQIINIKSGQCLDRNESVVFGSRDCAAQLSRTWNVVDSNQAGKGKIINMLDGKCMERPTEGINNIITMRPCTDDSRQLWSAVQLTPNGNIRPIATPPPSTTPPPEATPSEATLLSVVTQQTSTTPPPAATPPAPLYEVTERTSTTKQWCTIL
jgi:hypothetical protein